MAAKTANKTRFTLDLNDEMTERFNNLAESLGGSKSELMRKAIALIEVAADAKNKGLRMAVVDPDQKVVTTIVGL